MTVVVPIKELGFRTLNKVATVRNWLFRRVVHDHLDFLYSVVVLRPVESCYGGSREFKLLGVLVARIPQLLAEYPVVREKSTNKSLPVVNIIGLRLTLRWCLRLVRNRPRD